MSPITFLVLERPYQGSGGINVTQTAAFFPEVGKSGVSYLALVRVIVLKQAYPEPKIV